jgi:hypothetical protein
MEVAGALTRMEAVAVFPVPTLAADTVTELFLSPVVVPLTFTVTEQDAFAARGAPLRLTEPDPAVAVAVPPHVLERPLGVATTNPAGSVSVKVTPV